MWEGGVILQVSVQPLERWMLLMTVPIVRNTGLAVKLNPHLIRVENTRDELWKDTWAWLLFLLALYHLALLAPGAQGDSHLPGLHIDCIYFAAHMSFLLRREADLDI